MIKKILNDRRPLHLVPAALQDSVLIIVQKSYSFPPGEKFQHFPPDSQALLRISINVAIAISALLVALYIIFRQVEMKPT